MNEESDTEDGKTTCEKTCSDCGERFSYRTENASDTKRRLCDKCLTKRRLASQARNRKERNRAMAEILRDIWECSWNYPSRHEIKYAKKKPSGMSDVAWRIELRRRENAAYYDKFGDAP